MKKELKNPSHSRSNSLSEPNNQKKGKYKKYIPYINKKQEKKNSLLFFLFF